MQILGEPMHFNCIEIQYVLLIILGIEWISLATSINVFQNHCKPKLILLTPMVSAMVFSMKYMQYWFALCLP